MSATEIMDAIRTVAAPLVDERDTLHGVTKIKVNPADWQELVDSPDAHRSVFEDGDTRAIFGCPVTLDDAIPVGAPVAE